MLALSFCQKCFQTYVSTIGVGFQDTSSDTKHLFFVLCLAVTL